MYLYIIYFIEKRFFVFFAEMQARFLRFPHFFGKKFFLRPSTFSLTFPKNLSFLFQRKRNPSTSVASPRRKGAFRRTRPLTCYNCPLSRRSDKTEFLRFSFRRVCSKPTA